MIQKLVRRALTDVNILQNTDSTPKSKNNKKNRTRIRCYPSRSVNDSNQTVRDPLKFHQQVSKVRLQDQLIQSSSDEYVRTADRSSKTMRQNCTNTDATYQGLSQTMLIRLYLFPPEMQSRVQRGQVQRVQVKPRT